MSREAERKWFASVNDSHSSQRHDGWGTLRLEAAGEDGFELFGWDDFELGVGAGGGGLVCSPAAELSHVAEAIALHVFVGDFNDKLGAEGDPGEIFAGAPAAGSPGHALGSLRAAGVVRRPGRPGMVIEGVFAIRCEEGDEFLAFGQGEAGADSDVLERSGVVIEAKQERADGGSFGVLVPAEAGDDAVAVALMLDLEHGAFVGLVGSVEELGHDAVEAGAFEALEPVFGDGMVAGGGGLVDGRGGVFEDAGELGVAFGEGVMGEVFVAEREEVEEDNGRGSLLREEFDAGGGGVDAELECVEVEAAVGGDDDLTIEDAAWGELLKEDGLDVGEVAVERLGVAALDEDVAVVAEDEGAESVPLGLEEPLVALGKIGDALGEHWEDGRVDG